MFRTLKAKKKHVLLDKAGEMAATLAPEGGLLRTASSNLVSALTSIKDEAVAQMEALATGQGPPSPSPAEAGGSDGGLVAGSSVEADEATGAKELLEARAAAEEHRAAAQEMKQMSSKQMTQLAEQMHSKMPPPLHASRETRPSASRGSTRSRDAEGSTRLSLAGGAG